MRWLLGGLAVVLVCAGGAAGLYRTFVPGASCSPPGDEAGLLRSYDAEPVLSTPPVQGGPTFAYATQRYCDNVGVDALAPADDTERWTEFRTPGSWPSKTLRARYDPVSAVSGWAYVRQADDVPGRGDTCFTVIIHGTPYCLGDGVEYCKNIDGVTSFLWVTSEFRPAENHTSHIRVAIDAQWNTRTCPTPPASASDSADTTLTARRGVGYLVIKTHGEVRQVLELTAYRRSSAKNGRARPRNNDTLRDRRTRERAGIRSHPSPAASSMDVARSGGGGDDLRKCSPPPPPKLDPDHNTPIFCPITPSKDTVAV